MLETGSQRIGFAGTPVFAQRILTGLLDHGIRPALVLTAPDRPRGRGRKCLPTPVRELATRHDLPVSSPISLRTPQAVRELAEYALDLLIVAAYGLILPKAVLDLPRYGCLNVHPSLLPRWRGAAPIERAIMAGDVETGVCIMHMDEGLDSGPVLDSTRLGIHDGATGDDLRDALAELGLKRLLLVLKDLPNLRARPQAPTGITYAGKLTRADQKIDWHEDAHIVARQIHALNSAAPAFSQTNNGDETIQVRFLRVQCLPAPGGQKPGEVLAAPSGCVHIACGTGCVSVIEAAVLRGRGLPLSARELTNGFPDLFRTTKRFL